MVGDAVDDLVDQSGAAIYDKIMEYARPGVAELTEQAIDKVRAGLGEIVDEATDRAVRRARGSLNDIVDQATDEAITRARGSLNEIVDQAVAQASPQIKQVVLDTATEALQSGALQQAAAKTKREAAIALAIASVVTITGTVLLIKLLR